MPKGGNNTQNLTMMGQHLSTERAQELGRRSGERRREKAEKRKSAKEFAEMALNAEIENKKTGEKIVTKNAIIKKVISKALTEGDLNSVKYLFELVGDNPANKLEVTGADGKDLLPQKELTAKEIKELFLKLEAM